MSRMGKKKNKENSLGHSWMQENYVSVIFSSILPHKNNQVNHSNFTALHLFNFISYVFCPCLPIRLLGLSVPVPVTFEPVAQF